MSRTIACLVGILALQGLLTVWLYTAGSDNLAAYHTDEKLLAAVDMADVTKVVIQESGQPALEMVRQADQWLLPAAENFPVSPRKLEDFTKRLLGMQKSWPVATTDVTAKQLKTAENDFNRKVAFLRGDEERGVLFLGTSPGFKKVHARVGAEKPVYSIDFNAHDAPTKASEWYDRDLLVLKADDIERIEINGLALVNGEGGFRLADLQPNEEMNKEEAGSVVDKVAGLRFEDTLGTVEKPEYQKESVVAFSVVKKGGMKIDYAVGGLDDKSYVLKSSVQPFYFKAAKGPFDKLKGVTRQGLVKAVPNTPAAQTESPAAPAAGEGEAPAAAEGFAPPAP